MRSKALILIVFALFAVLPVSAQESSAPAQQFEGFHLEGYGEGGQKAWDVTGDTANMKGSTVEITNVDANSYTEQEVNIKSRTGKIDQSTGNVELRRDVVITTKEGVQLKTDTLHWAKKADLITTDDPVKVTDKNLVATGQGLTAHPSLKTAQMNQDVTVEMITQDKKTGKSGKLVITSDGPMIMDQRNNKATFKENVVAVYGERTLTADKVDVYVHPDTQDLQRIVCVGNVTITQGENTSLSDKAIYNALDQTMTLTGRPKLILITEGEGRVDSL